MPNGRLTDKFPSTTTLWLILRKFESSVSAPKKNFTARGVPRVTVGDSGPGRLYYETPVLNAMGRELSSFTDLQKTLAQLGFHNGNVMLRLSFMLTEIRLEEAMLQIEEYFNMEKMEVSQGTEAGESVEGALSSEITQQPDASTAMETEAATVPINGTFESISSITESMPPSTSEQQNVQLSPTTASGPSQSSTVSGPGNRAIDIFAPPSSTTPLAARQPHDEAAFEPTIQHAKLHQSRLASTGQNKRLPTHAEEAAQKEAHAQRIAGVKEVEIKIRFPDQTQVVSKFSSEDTAESIYAFVKGLMVNGNQPFWLNYTSPRGMKTVPRDGKERLIAGLGMVGRMLVNVVWDEGASVEARLGSVLKVEFRQQAREIEIKELKGVEVEEEEVVVEKDKGKGKEKEGGKGKGGVPKWLKLPGKK